MSMIYPPLNDLLEKVDCRYTLVVETAKRARQLVDGSEPLVETESTKPVFIAVEEIEVDKVTYERIREGIK
jgi:DNA-directed RNA polymerase subunit omega